MAVACLTSVSFFTDRVRRATEQHATELLAADLVLISSTRIADKYLNQAIDQGLVYSLNENFRSVVVKNNKLERAEFKAVDLNYPIRYHLRARETMFGKDLVPDSIPAQGTVWIDSRLMQTLHAKPGESINLGASRLNIDKILLQVFLVLYLIK